MTGPREDAVVRVLLDRYGRSYASQTGIRLRDAPAPLYQLLVLANLLSARIAGEIAVAAAQELFAAGYRNPRAMRKASWQQRVDALGRGHYRRYDERTATQLGDGAVLLIERWHGDLRMLRDEAGGEPGRVAELLTEFPGIGPSGADIFLREVQAAWPQVAPFADQRVLDGAAELGLPRDVGQLAALAGSRRRLAQLAAALIRVSGGRGRVQEVVTAASS